MMLILAAIAALVAIFAYVFYARSFGNGMQEKHEASNGNDIKPCKKSKSESVVVPSATAKGNVHKRNTANNAAMVKKQQRAADANYTHPWLYTTLKGHTGKVLDIDYSSNGKYLATCSEDSSSTLSLLNIKTNSDHLINEKVNVNEEEEEEEESTTTSSSSRSSCCSSGNSSSNSLEDSPNPHQSNKKQRKFTKKKNNFQKFLTKTTSKSSSSISTKTESPSAAVAAVSDEPSIIIKNKAKYFYNSTSTSSSSSSLSSTSVSPSSSPTASPTVTKKQQSPNSNSNSTVKYNVPPPPIGAPVVAAGNSIRNSKNSRANLPLNKSHSNGHFDNQLSKKSATLDKVVNLNMAAQNLDDSTPLRQFVKLNMSENELVKYLRKYLLDKDLMKQLGFPVEYGLDLDKAIIYKYEPDFFRRPFYPSSVKSVQDDNDSGQGSGTSSPTNVDDTDTLLMYRISSTQSKSSFKDQFKLQPSEERECCRCGKGFFLTLDGEYLTQEHCIYHWGKANKIYYQNEKGLLEFKKFYTCCNGDSDTKGCTINKLHVWSGLASGYNGPFEGYVKTKPSPRKLKRFQQLLMNKFYYQNDVNSYLEFTHDDLINNSNFMNNDCEEASDGVYALDCEMSYTGRGLELTRVTVVGCDGRLVYEKLVKPEAEIVDYNTRFSGLTEKDFLDSKNYVTLKQVQKDLLKFIYDDTILVGHSIENDLKVLKIIHKTVIDTSITFPHINGYPFRQSLKSLTKNILKRDIQMIIGEVNSNSHVTSNGHCSREDSRASLELMLWRVRKDKITYDSFYRVKA